MSEVAKDIFKKGNGMRKISKFISCVLLMTVVNMPCLYAKTNVEGSKFFNDIVRKGRYILPLETENNEIPLPMIDENAVLDTPNREVPQHSEKSSVDESIMAVLVAVGLVAVVLKLLCENIRMPFDYDPNIRSKRVIYKRVRNKKFKKR